MNAAGGSLPLLRCRFVRPLGVALTAIAVLAVLAASTDALAWDAGGEIDMRYRQVVGGTIFGRNAATISQTVDTDIIISIEVGGTSGPNDTDPGSLSISNLGTLATPRALGDVDVNVGPLTLIDSVVSGRFVVTRPTSVMVMRLSTLGPGSDITVSNGGTFTCELSHIYPVIRAGGIARVSGCTGSVGSVIGADIEIDSSALTSGNFQGKQVITDSTVTGISGTLRQGEFDFTNVTLDMQSGFTVGGNTTGAVPTDTDFVLNASLFETDTGTIRAGLGIATDFEMQGASSWLSFGLFTVIHETTHLDINSGSRIDARADFYISSAFVTIGSGTATSSRIDVGGDLILDGSLPGALTIENGAVVDVDGTLTIGPNATVNLNGGLLRVDAFDNQGTFNENGGTFIVPEPTGAVSALAAALTLAWLRRGRRRA